MKECFKTDHPLKKTLNQKTLKLSYSCMLNLYRKENRHTQQVTSTKAYTNTRKLCNCQSKPNCPLNGRGLTTDIVYQATVECENKKETYIGLTGDQFNYSVIELTTLPPSETHEKGMQHIWTLKDNHTILEDFTLSWKITARANPYSNTSEQYNLCLSEKYFIICEPSRFVFIEQKK